MFVARFFLLMPLVICSVLTADQPAPRSPKVALQPFNSLIGTWRCTGTPAGSREQQQKGFWTETIDCEWQFKGSDSWLRLKFDKGKNFIGGELRYLPQDDQFALTLRNIAKESLVFKGSLKEKVLTLDRPTDEETQRLVFTMLHENRFLYRYETRPGGKTLFTKQYSVGATKEGVPFAGGDGKPTCVVSGGVGTMPVSYMGKTYYVCCGGCRDEFRENPEKYIKEFENTKKAKK